MVPFLNGKSENVSEDDAMYARRNGFDRSNSFWVALFLRAYAQATLRDTLLAAIFVSAEAGRCELVVDLYGPLAAEEGEHLSGWTVVDELAGRKDGDLVQRLNDPMRWVLMTTVDPRFARLRKSCIICISVAGSWPAVGSST